MAGWQGVGAVRESAIIFQHYMIDNHKKTSYLGSQKGVILKRIDLSLNLLSEVQESHSEKAHLRVSGYEKCPGSSEAPVLTTMFGNQTGALSECLLHMNSASSKWPIWFLPLTYPLQFIAPLAKHIYLTAKPRIPSRTDTTHLN